MAQEEKCVICGEAITNPVCPDCLGKQIVYWISERNPSLVPVVKNITEGNREYSHGGTSCIICKNEIYICPHCYCNDIYSWLTDNGHDETAKMFLRHFNYELDYRFDLKVIGYKKAEIS